jgi:hypothetical protein
MNRAVLRRWLATCTGFVALIAPAVARATSGPGPRALRPWAFRGDGFVVSGAGIFGATAGALGITVQRSLWERFAWEETIARGMGNREVDGKDIGWVFAGTGRAALWITDERTHAVTLGVGSALVVGGGYGKLNFAFAELGYEYRSRLGITVLLALGPNILLTSPSVDLCHGETWFCSNFSRGNLVPLGHGRAGIGWAF